MPKKLNIKKLHAPKSTKPRAKPKESAFGSKNRYNERKKKK